MRRGCYQDATAESTLRRRILRAALGQFVTGSTDGGNGRRKSGLKSGYEVAGQLVDGVGIRT